MDSLEFQTSIVIIIKSSEPIDVISEKMGISPTKVSQNQNAADSNANNLWAYKKRFIDKLSAYMRTNGITYYKLAKSLDIGQTTLKRWFLNGSMPETTILIRISKLLGERLDDLFGRGISLDG